jgi:nicotinate-nucleotide adenylyltransferase
MHGQPGDCARDILRPMLIGLFGGTFDPPHLGHLALSREAVSDLQVERLLWLLTPNPPHKTHRTITPLPHRLQMVELALEGTPFELSRIDIDRPAPHYALDTVRIVREQNPEARLLYLMGSDSLNDLPTWHRAAEFVQALDFIGVMHREGELPNLPALEVHLPGLAAKVRFVEAPRVDISASQVRALVRKGKPFEHLLPPAVADYIKNNKLYQAPTPIPGS